MVFTLTAKASGSQQFTQTQPADKAEIDALRLAIKGHVSIIFPVGDRYACEAAPGSIFDRRSNEFARAWYKVTLKFRCAGEEGEITDLWFLCMDRRNQIVCQIMNKPNDID